MNLRNLFCLISLSISLLTANAQTRPQLVEYLDWNAARINGTVPLLTPPAKLYKVLGKPDSIVKADMENICVSYFDKPFKQVYIKGSDFELVGDKIVVSTLNFKNTDLKLIIGDLTLNSLTTLASLSKRFPQAVKKQAPMTIKKQKLVSIRLETGKKPSDSNWILFFENGKLVRIDYWMPC